MKKILFLFTLLLSCSLSYAADTTEKSADSLSFYNAVKKNINFLAEKLNTYDSLYVCAIDNDEFMVVTDSVLYKDGSFNGLYMLAVKVNADSTVKVETALSSNFIVTKKIFTYKGTLDSSLVADPKWYNLQRPYGAILINKEIVYEHFLPINEVLGSFSSLSEEDSIFVSLVSLYLSYQHLFGNQLKIHF